MSWQEEVEAYIDSIPKTTKKVVEVCDGYISIKWQHALPQPTPAHWPSFMTKQLSFNIRRIQVDDISVVDKNASIKHMYYCLVSCINSSLDISKQKKRKYEAILFEMNMRQSTYFELVVSLLSHVHKLSNQESKNKLIMATLDAVAAKEKINGR